jgi:nitrate/TMAO reductase-like tetraheme cytochrome c subunit
VGLFVALCGEPGRAGKRIVARWLFWYILCGCENEFYCEVALSRILGKVKDVTKRHAFAFVLGFAFALAAYLSIGALEGPFATSTFCGTACHELKPAYDSWLESPHNVNVQGLKAECVECHLPPQEQFIYNLYEKGRTGSVEVWRHFMGPEYDRPTITSRVKAGMSNDTCLRCHKDLLAQPSSRAVMYMHKGALASPNDPYGKCVVCHTVHARKTESRLAEEE